jgi:CRP-like cAMP-binding protein
MAAMDPTEKLPFYRLLSESEQDLLNRESNLVTYENREVIFKQETRSSPLMYLEEGLVRIYKTGKSKKVIMLRLTSPGNFIGLLSVFGSDIHQYSAASVGVSRVRFFDQSAFLQTLEKNGRLARRVIQEICHDGLNIFEKLMSHTQKQLPGKVAEVILFFCEELYHSEEFELPLTREELAQLAGTTKESFIRTFSEFRHDKIIELDGKRVKINSMKILKILNELG